MSEGIIQLTMSSVPLGQANPWGGGLGGCCGGCGGDEGCCACPADGAALAVVCGVNCMLFDLPEPHDARVSTRATIVRTYATRPDCTIPAPPLTARVVWRSGTRGMSRSDYTRAEVLSAGAWNRAATAQIAAELGVTESQILFVRTNEQIPTGPAPLATG